MFYEPLSYVLDETTKEFVREVVEELVAAKVESDVIRNSSDCPNNVAIRCRRLAESLMIRLVLNFSLIDAFVLKNCVQNGNELLGND